MDAVLHQVLLADLNNLAKIWGISSDNIGLEINAEGELVPKFIDEGDGDASLSEMKYVAEQNFPGSHELEIVVSVYEGRDGNKMAVSTREYVCSPECTTINAHWWTFTDDYRGQMN